VKGLNVNQSGNDMLKSELTINILLDLLFGRSSEPYAEMYNEGLIDPTFSYDYTQENGFGFAMIGGDTEHPDQLAERLHDIMFAAKENGNYLDAASLERVKKKKIGAFLRQLNSPEFIANQFTRYSFNEMNLFDVVPTIEKIQFEDVKKAAQQFFEEERFTTFQVLPK